MAKLEETKPPAPEPGHGHEPEVVVRVRTATRQGWRRFRRFLAGLGFSTLGMALLALALVLGVLRFYGVPPQAKAYLLRELEARGVAVSVDRFLLGPDGDLIAERVSVFRSPARQELLLQVDRVRLGIAWFSWWRGQPLLQNATVGNATLNLPLTDVSTVAMRQVSAAVDFTPGGLIVRSASARVLNLLVELHGTVVLDGPLPKRDPSTPEARRKLDELWRQALSFSDDLDTQRPIKLRLDFVVRSSAPEKATVQGEVAASDFLWRGARVDGLAADFALADQAVTLSDLRVSLARGELTVDGEADLAKGTAHAEFYSNLDFTQLAAALPPHVGEAVARLSFNELPVTSGHLDAAWLGESPALNLQADVDWQAFTYGGVPFNRLSIPLAYDGHRLFIPQAILAMDGGEVKVDALYDRAKPEIRARIDSTLDITALQGVFSPQADLFLQSLHFNGPGPVAAITVTGASANPREWLVAGKGRIIDCSYKGIAIASAEADFAYRNSVLDLNSFVVHRKEGTVSGTLHDDFLNRMVRIDSLAADVDVQEVAPALGAKFASYVAPYHFDRPPKLKVHGTVDLNDKKPRLDTDISVAIDSDSTLRAVIYHLPLPIERAQARLRVVDRLLTLRCERADLFGGKLEGTLKAALDPTRPTIDVALKVAGGDFQKAMTTLYHNDQSTGVFDLQLNLAGALGDLATFQGDGSLAVSDGYILSIPFLGGLSKLVGGIIPGFGSSKADRGRCAFKIADGVLHTDDLTVSSMTFSVIGSGQADFVRNALDFDARVNVRGVMGLLLFPVSKLFEYHGSGSLKEPVWKPKNL